MNVTELANEVRRKAKLVVVVGDAMTDVWLHGSVSPCQDGCPKFVVRQRVSAPGGAANAARSLMRWDGRIGLFSSSTHYTMTSLTTKTRLVVDDTIVQRVDEENVPCPLSDYYRRLLLESVPFAGAVLLSDYDKGVLTPDLIRDVVTLCKRHHIPCVADCKRGPKVYSGCILKGNLSWRHTYDAELPSRYVITQGDAPPYGHDDDTAWSLNPMPDVPCVNHVGAGDCFAAHLALGLAYGLGLRDAARLADAASRIYVQRPYNEPPRPAEVAAMAGAISRCEDAPRGVPGNEMAPAP